MTDVLVAIATAAAPLALSPPPGVAASVAEEGARFGDCLSLLVSLLEIRRR
jgi:hypothetical protein